MAMVETDLGITRERAREVRFEQASGITATNVQKAIEQVGSQPPIVTETAVNFAASPFVPAATDTFLAVDTSGGAITINLAAAGTRTRPLTIKDVSGNAAANPITINPTGAETVDTLAPLTIGADFGGYTLNPRSTGYTLAP